MTDDQRIQIATTTTVIPAIVVPSLSSSLTVLPVEDKEATRIELITGPWDLERECQHCGASDPPIVNVSRYIQYLSAFGLCLLCFPLGLIPVRDNWCLVTEYKCKKCDKLRAKANNCC